MDIKELLLSFVGKTINKPADEVSSLLFEKDAENKEVLKADALNQLYELDKVRVSKFESDNKVHYDKGFKKAEAEIRSKVEKELKDEYQYTGEEKGLELFKAVLNTKVTGSELEEEKVKRSKTYLDMVDGLKKEKTKVETDWKEKYEGREKELQSKETFKSISDKALTFVKSLNPILPADAKKAENQINILLNQMKDYQYDVKEDGKIVVLKKEGDEYKVLVDAHKHPVSFEEMVKGHADSLWDFKKGEERGGTGNNNDDPAGTGANKGYTGPIPKNDAEYSKMIAEAKDEDTKIQITKAYTKT